MVSHQFFRFITLIMVLVLSVAVASAQGDQEGYRLGTGDKVKVTVFGHENLSGESDIDSTGHLALPLIQTVKARGLTVQELERSIVAKLSPDYIKNPRVSVEVISNRPFFILGEVQKPGSYPYVNDMTVVTAVALAGGFTYRADTDEVYITRATDKGKTKQSADQNTPVLPGDVIEVPERYF
ncbi:MAG: polysaccharide biosynthesis/export family protein [Gammaproteobacteria bacterium]